MPHHDDLTPTAESPRRASVPPLALSVVLPPEQFEALAVRVAELISDGRDDGFLDVPGAAEYLCTTPKAVYHLVERQRVPHHRAGGRLLFDRADLRAWVERG
jgi:excisionase family DNA binding protein